MNKKIAGFTLVEIMISLVLFSILMAATSSVFFTVQNSAIKQRQAIELGDNLRWGENYILTDIREASASSLHNLTSKGVDGFNCTNVAGSTVWYWRGNNTQSGIATGNSTTIYRARGSIFNSTLTASSQELVNFIVNNTAGAPVFNVSLSLSSVTVEMKVREYPANPAGQGNREYRIRTTVCARN